MSVPLYMDVHVKLTVTNGLRLRGVDVLTAQEDGRAVLPDEKLLERATSQGRLVFTQDEDFLAIATEWQLSGKPFFGVAYSHQMSITVGQAVMQLELICKVMTPDELRSTILYLPF